MGGMLMNRINCTLLMIVILFIINDVEAAIIINNLGTGSGTIKLYSILPPEGMLIESCNVGPVSNCQLGVSQDTINGNVIQLVGRDGSFINGWGATNGNVGGCSNSTRICNITGSTAGGGHDVSATFTSCIIDVETNNFSFSWAGGAGNITIITNNPLCEWSALSNNNWIKISGATNGTGSATISYFLSVNKIRESRNGTIVVAGNEVKVYQEPYLPYIDIFSETIEFGTVKTGIMSERQVTINNTSASNTININSVQITGEHSSVFTAAHNCSSLSPNSSCLARLAVRPQSAGAFNGNLVINSDDPFSPSYEVSITGTSSSTASANISVSPQSFTLSPIDFEFGHVRTIQVTNTGTGSLLIDNLRFAGRNSGEFLILNTCPIIQTNNSCNLTFYSYYSSNNPKYASLLIGSNAQNTPVVEIPITASSPTCMTGSLYFAETSKTLDNEGAAFATAITRTGGSGCLWFALNSASWINSSLTNTELQYTVQSNDTNTLRMSNIKVGGEVFTVIQHKDANNKTFDDIAGNYFADYINAIYSHRITIGCIQDVSYCPQGFVTRGEMAAFIIRALQGEGINYTLTPYFTDVPASHNFFKYVQKMRDLGITVVSGQFRVNDSVTRGEMAAFIIRAVFGEDFSFTQAPYFTDVPSNHIFFKYVQKMKDAGITAITGAYRVEDNVTRQEMAAFLGRAFLGMR